MASERQETETVSPWWGEHIHRYDEVSKNLQGNEIVLDIACGSGFGSNLLAKNTSSNVFGGDIDEKAIALCKKSWNKENLIYKKMDATKLSFDDNTFDIVVSFETIEHTTEYLSMLKELKRVTKPNGTLYISTPNFIINSPFGIVTNPYHTQEWTFQELENILNKVFPKVDLLGQQYNRYSQKSFGKTIENLMYKRGIRKIPMPIQDIIMRSLIGRPMYPLSDDFELTSNKKEIKKCKTFFCICKKQ